MAYFDRFPIVAGYEIHGRTFDMMDITRRTGFLQSVRDNEAYYIEHSSEILVPGNKLNLQTIQPSQYR